MIGIAFLEEPHPSIPLGSKRDTHCGYMGRALKGETVQVHLDRLSCPVARYVMGLDVPTREKAAVALRRFRDMDTVELADAYLQAGGRLGDVGPYVVYFPWPHPGLEADVLIEVTSVAEAADVVHDLAARTGERLEASVSGIGAACGESTVYPLATGRANVSLGCRGCRPKMAMAADQVILSAPRGHPLYALLEERAEA
jgi:uncharacterized protein (DUF169 family)